MTVGCREKSIIRIIVSTISIITITLNGGGRWPGGRGSSFFLPHHHHHHQSQHRQRRHPQHHPDDAMMTMLRMTMSNARISIFTIRDIIMILFLESTLGVLGDEAHVSHMRYTNE